VSIFDCITILLLCVSCVLRLLSQLERVLSSEQRRSDFMPRDDALSFDRPTSACLLGTALLSALGGAAKDTLDGNNLRAFLAEVSVRVSVRMHACVCVGVRVCGVCSMGTRAAKTRPLTFTGPGLQLLS
jgi:hypothetical protein